MLEKDIEGRDALEIASKLEFYELFQDRNVQEVIMAIWKGKYAIEGSFFDVSSSIMILKDVPFDAKGDPELELRFDRRD